MARITKVTSRIGYLALSCLMCASLAFAAPRRISKDLKKQSSQQWVNVIVQYRIPPTQAISPESWLRAAVTAELARDQRRAFTVKGSSLTALTKDPDVAYVSPDRTVRATATVTDYYDQAVLAPYAWSKNLLGMGSESQSSTAESAVGKTSRLSNGTGSRIVYSQNFAVGQSTVADLYGHGTACCGHSRR